MYAARVNTTLSAPVARPWGGLDKAAEPRRTGGAHRDPAFSFDFGRIAIFPPEPRPHIESVRFGSVLPASAGSGQSASPDKSTVESDEMQDQASQKTFQANSSGHGVRIEMTGGNPTGTKDFPDGIRWLQTIDTNDPKGGASPPYVDPQPNDDNKPFYWTDSEESSFGGTFSDRPNRPSPATGATRWDATLSLVGVSGKNVTRLDSVTYGFSLDSAGTLTLRAPKAAGVSDIVVQGDTARSDFSDWNFLGGFAVPQVPPPQPGGPAVA
jgi:hypothetical protein